MLPVDPEERIAAIRSFNRFFTRQIGALREGLLHTPYPLTEARILFEIAHGENLTASELGRELGLDPGYLSRILARLEGQGLIERVQSTQDARLRHLHLTEKGCETFVTLDQRSRDEISDMLAELDDGEQQSLLKAMRTVQSILDRGRALKYAEPFILRDPQPGDMGWVTHRHGALYAQEYGWDAHFEALVAQIVADFVNHFDPARERCWIAEMDSEIVGSVFVVKVDDEVAKLRLLLVEPRARGLRLGSRLVEECIRFAKRVGYKKMTLWTNSVLTSARKIYQRSGFKLVEEEAHHSYGHDLVGENWELDL
jgi:DNA-binding MarR family transcriptional regulator/GNAT superfamily N-acetyltransferase